VNSHVVLYADTLTGSIQVALAETARRREIQLAYNAENHITPQTIRKPVREQEVDLTDVRHIPKAVIPNMIIELEAQMKAAAENLDFEQAISLRDRMRHMRERLGASGGEGD
jgi:excinuclease ABC subunit B